MKTCTKLFLASLALTVASYTYAQQGPFDIRVVNQTPLLAVEEMNQGRTNEWNPIHPSITYHTDRKTGAEYEVDANKGTLAFAVVRDKKHNVDRRIEISSGGAMITIRNFCVENNERISGRDQYRIEYYVYMVGQDYAYLNDCDAEQSRIISAYEIARIFALAHREPPYLHKTLNAIRIAMYGAIDRARSRLRRN